MVSKPYKILLYNNGKRVKVIDQIATYNESVKVYNQIFEANVCFFPKEYDWLGKETDYELVLIGPKTGTSINHFRNEMGALVKVKPKGDFVIKKIKPYPIEEVFKHKNTDEKHTFRSFVKKFLVNNDNTRVILSMSNKLIIEYFENEQLDVFVLKNQSDSVRLNETIKVFTQTNGLTNFIFFDDPTLDTIKRVYDALEANYGISREWMARTSTR
jgi:hypothetical protein